MIKTIISIHAIKARQGRNGNSCNDTMAQKVHFLYEFFACFRLTVRQPIMMMPLYHPMTDLTRREPAV